MDYIQQHQGPKFKVYPKRKSSMEPMAELYMRTSYQMCRVEKSLGLKIVFTQWDTVSQSVTGNPLQQHLLNGRLMEYQQKVMGAYYMLTQNGAEATLTELMDMAFAKEGGRVHSLFGLFRDTIVKMVKVADPVRGRSNILKHESCLRHLTGFVRGRFRMNDVPFNRINRQFIDDFENYLLTEGGNGHNSANKMLQIFKKVYRIALDNRWTAHNAFASRRLTYRKVQKPYLTGEELGRLASCALPSNRLCAVRDMFVFSCYTGLAYIDILTLRRKHIECRQCGTVHFIRKNRSKTGVESIVPLFQPAQAVLETYSSGWNALAPETVLLPVISNQRYNIYLKEVAAFCNLDKNLTTHVARHTFATTVTLENGVSMESVSKMLGHSKLSQTQEYAKVTELKIERDTSTLFEMLKR